MNADPLVTNDASVASVAGSGLKLAYLCGALRVSTRDDANASLGPRAHVVGFLGALRRRDVQVQEFLAGNMFARGAQAIGTSDSKSSLARALVTDAGRLAFRARLNLALRSALEPDVDLVYERQATLQDLGRAARRRLDVPWIVESNGPFWYEAGKERGNLALTGYAKRMELRAYRDADLLVAVSDVLKDILVSESGAAEERVLVLPNAVDATRFDPDDVVPRRLSEKPTVGFVGYLTEWAGIDLLIRAVAVLSRTGREVHAVIAGEGPAYPALRVLASELGVSEAVTFLGRVAWGEVPSYVAGFDVCYSGQRKMAIGGMYHSPLKLYEYQCMGRPVIASRHRDAARLVEESQGGWLFESEDVESLIDALTRALDCGELDLVGARARANVLARHTWDARVGTLFDELKQRGLLPS